MFTCLKTKVQRRVPANVAAVLPVYVFDESVV